MEEKLKFFKELNPKEKCQELAKNYDIALELEKISLSEYSPKIIQISEKLARIIFSPLHIEENGSIKPSAFEDVKDKGLSVHRLNYIDDENIKMIGTSMVKIATENGRSPRTFAGYITVLTDEVYKLIENNKRLFAIYDTATDKEPSHADICAILLSSPNLTLSKKAANKQRRKSLQKIFSKLI